MKKKWMDHDLKRWWAKLLLIMRLTTVFMLLAMLTVHAKTYSQQTKLSFSFQQTSVAKVLSYIEEESEFYFFYKENELQSERLINIDAAKEDIHQVLDKILEGTTLGYSVVDRYVVISPKDGNGVKSVEQEISISGKVTDTSGQPLPGVTVVVKGTTQGTITDGDGNYSISNVNSDGVLIFSFVGMKSQEMPVDGKSIVNITMEEDAIGIDEVVAVGYGTMKKSDLTGSIASVNSKDLGEVSSDSFTRSLSGKVAGVQIQQTTGTPGGNMVIRVRGASSLSAGNDPLYVIDGFPVQQENISAQDQGFNPLSSLNPDDIESIEVLKDASASAIYGSRGANGVVLITTKSGSSGKAKLSFNTSIGVQSIINKMELLNGDEYIDFVRDAYENAKATIDPNFKFPAFIVDDSPYRGINTDWQDQIFRAALVQNYQLSASGGTDKVQYFLSGNYMNEEGIVLSSGFQRFSLRSNITTQLADFLKLGMNFTPSYTANDEVNAEGHWAENAVINEALVAFPFLRPDESPEDYVNSDPNYDCCGVTNPVITAEDFDATSTQFRVLSTVYMEATIVDGLKAKTTLGIDFSNWERNEFNPGYLKRNTNDNSANSRTLSRRSWLTENTLTYSKKLNNHSFTALGGFTFQQYREQDNFINANKLTNDIVHTINDFNTVIDASSEIEEWGLVSCLGRLNYSYDNKYLFTATIRTDGSSRFGSNNQFATFPSASAGWIVSEEKFMKSFEKISRLKFRLSSGKSGNNRIGNYSSVARLNSSNYVFGSGNGTSVSGLYSGNIGNPDLTWETTVQSDLGLELGLFDNRIYAIADYYKSETKGLLLNVPIPTSSGFGSALQNLGRVENKGIELSLNTRNFEGEFKWTTNFNISFNKNKILELGPEGDPIRAGSGAGNVYLNEIGGELGAFYVYEQIGIFQNQEEIDNSATWNTSRGTYPGDVKYKDQNNDGVIDSNDQVMIGSNNPDFTWGLTNTLGYKNFDLSIIINGVEGAYVHNVARRFYNNLEGNQNQTSDVLNRWRSESEPGDGITPRANRLTSGNNNVAESSRWIEDASFIRIQDITLGYNFPTYVANRLGLEKLRAYAAVSNLAYFTDYTGYNPEVSFNGGSALSKGSDYGSYPLSKRFTLGIKVDF
ncbi:TonB-dependent receptor [Sunxiuqinia sp. A32]|uniref:TonB-dependent receptor n=1 Tax=Sunxiuqinia sp. A32 TaxID=3461496 RepID=UPI00404636B0